MASKLTPRDEQVMHRVCLGFTSREIAEDLGMSPRTVEFRLWKINGKLGATTGAQAAVIFDRMERERAA